MRSQRESGHVFIHEKCARDHRGQEPVQAEPEALAIDNTPSFYQTEALGEMDRSNLSIMVPTLSLPHYMLAFINLRQYCTISKEHWTIGIFPRRCNSLFFFQSTSVELQPLIVENILAVTINLHNILVMSFSPTCTHSLNYPYWLSFKTYFNQLTYTNAILEANENMLKWRTRT